MEIFYFNINPEDKFNLNTLKTGNVGYLDKDEDLDNLLLAIRKIYVFARYLS